LIDRRLLENKSKTETEQLLGKADFDQSRWLGYKVVTISRCYFWACRMEISFNDQNNLVESVAVSD
jgi:hypothetical protein